MYHLNKTLNILIIEDSPSDAFLIAEFLDEIPDFICDQTHCETLKEGVEELNRKNFDIVLVDYNLPDSHGAIQFERIFKQHSHTPFIVLTGLTDKAVSIDALNRGAKDYLIKGDFDPNLLNRSILYALERKRLEEENVIKILSAQDKEKERIARDVHDTLGQNLTSAVLQIQSIKSMIDSNNLELMDSIDTALKCINEAIGESRGISRSLMPQTVQKFGLASGIESILMILAANSNISFKFENNLDFVRFDEKKELALFRIAQESINNILKYSKAKHAKIKLIIVDELLLMQIEDDGIGFDVDRSENQKGIGLESIQTRAKAISAKLEIHSKLNEGTIVRVITEIQNANYGKD